jgi:toxin-antitoxin system PIN domain toxin
VTPATLLDVNVLVALFDADHVHHEIAHDWYSEHGEPAWATCPVTENGFIRVVTNPGYGLDGFRAHAAQQRLARFCKSPHHVFWADAVSLRDTRLFHLSAARGHGQLTDVYLLGLAVTMQGRLATFDRTIPVEAVKGARPETLQIISPGARTRGAR